MTNTPVPTLAAQWQALKVLALVLTGAVVVITIALIFVLGPDSLTVPDPVFLAGVPVLLGIANAGILLATGYRARPLPAATPVDEAVAAAMTVFRTTFMLRFAFAEMPFIVGIALSFIASEGGLTVLLGTIVVTAALLAWHVFPNDWQVRRIEQALSADGAYVPLGAAVHGAS